jgi:hypothetical protein
VISRNRKRMKKRYEEKMKLQECGCCWWNGREFGINVSGAAE